MSPHQPNKGVFKMTANEMYVALCDMDVSDYTETYEQDICFIQSMIDRHGATAAYRLLYDMIFQ